MATIGRPRAFDREAALEAAMLVFWRQGFLGASMTDLCAAMGIRSPSLYAAFGSKEALYREAVDHYNRTIGLLVWDRLADGATAREGVESLLRTAANFLPRRRTRPAGCMVTLGAVSEACPGGGQDLFRDARLDCLEWLRTRLRDAAARGELPDHVDIDRLSRFYFSVYEGMAVQAHDGATATDLAGIVDVAMGAWPNKAPALSA